MVLLACGPMMHGGSQWILGNGHVAGQTIALYTEPHFDAAKILDLVERAKVVSLTFLGDAMGRPVAEAILAEPDRWDLSSLAAVSNGAAPLSDGVREEIRRHCRAASSSTRTAPRSRALPAPAMDDGSRGRRRLPAFTVNDQVEVFDAGAEAVPAGRRRDARPVPGRCRWADYKDPVKTAATFKEVDGVRWVDPRRLRPHARRTAR